MGACLSRQLVDEVAVVCHRHLLLGRKYGLRCGKLRKREQTEHTEEFFSCCIEHRTSGGVQPAASLDKSLVDKGVHGIGAVNSSDLINEGTGYGLIICNYSKDFHRGSGEVTASADTESLSYVGSVLLLGAELTGLLKGQQADASLGLVGVIGLCHMLNESSDVVLVKPQHLCKLGLFNGVTCGVKNSLNSPLYIFELIDLIIH